MSATVTSPVTPTEDERRKRAWRPLAAAAAAGSVLVITGFGVWASLNATATGVTSVNSGTLRLVMSDNGVGFTTGLSNLAPGDVVNRFVKLTNTGTLDGKSLTMAIAATGDSALITDSGTRKAAVVSVQNCTNAWTVASNASSCGGGTVTTLLAPTTVGTLSTAATLANVGTLAASTGALNLKVSVTIPDQTETSVNGAAVANSIQNANASLAYTFAETQRDAATTTS